MKSRREEVGERKRENIGNQVGAKTFCTSHKYPMSKLCVRSTFGFDVGFMRSLNDLRKISSQKHKTLNDKLDLA